jgi:hypothetical protein
MDAKQINSISEFLLHAGTDYLVFDLGRRLSSLESQTFLDIENGTLVAPFPRQKHGWFGIVFWNKEASEQHYIWFIKLPLDEQGLVVTASRNHFLQIIVDALGHSITDDSDKQQTLPDNPYSFVPSQSQLAQFNAAVRQSLALPVSKSAEQVIAYIKAPQVVDWQTIALQGIADIASQLENVNKANELIEPTVQQFSLFAPSFQQSFMEMCESFSVPQRIRDFMLDKIDADDAINLAALRGVSQPQKDPVLTEKLTSLLASGKMNRVDILSVIAARHFTQMDAPLIHAFFEAVVQVDNDENYDGELFIGFFTDLVQVPSLRHAMLAMLRAPERSELLSRCIGKLFAQTKG